MVNTTTNIFTDPNWLSAIAAIASAVISLIGIPFLLGTLFEMQKQRRATYRPQLLIEDSNVYIERTPKGRPIKWKTTPTRLTEGTEIEFVSEYPITVHNVGFGSATNLEIRFVPDVEKMCRLIDERKSTRIAKKDVEGPELAVYSFDSSKNGWTFIIEEKPEVVTFPLLARDSKLTVNFPDAARCFVTIVSIAIGEELNTVAEIALEVPMSIVFVYKDISGVAKEKVFGMKLSLTVINGEHYVNYGSGRFIYEIKKDAEQ